MLFECRLSNLTLGIAGRQHTCKREPGCVRAEPCGGSGSWRRRGCHHPLDPDVRRSQHLFLGLSVNMQGLIDLALADRRHVVARKGRAVGHLVFELFNPPFGSAAVVGATRSPDD